MWGFAVGEHLTREHVLSNMLSISSLHPGKNGLLARFLPVLLKQPFPQGFTAEKSLECECKQQVPGELVTGGTRTFPALVGTGWFLGVTLGWAGWE